jgi:hypothetical protein
MNRLSRVALGWSLRPRPHGRHALGAAVTGLPTAPVQSTPLLVEQQVPAPEQALDSPTVPAPRQPPHLPPAPLPVPVQAPPPAAAAPPVAAPPVAAPPVTAPPAPAPPPVVAPPAAAAPPRPRGPRVQLGFADGTYSTLDPTSDAARALAAVVDQLTAGDARPGATAS